MTLIERILFVAMIGVILLTLDHQERRINNLEIRMTSLELRTELLENSMKVLKNLSTFYNPGSPAWILIQNAWGHINSVHHLETQTTIGDETLGVKTGPKKCSTCSHPIVTPNYCDYCATEIE